MVRLGTGSGDMKRLTPDAIERGVDALRRMKQIADIDGAPVRAVATSAVREAENHDEFVAAARERGRASRSRSSPASRRPGSSTSACCRRCRSSTAGCCCATSAAARPRCWSASGARSLAARSFKLGAVRLTNRFFPGERLHPSAVSSCRTFVRSTLSPFSREVAAHGFEVAVGSSGTIQAVAAHGPGRDRRRAAPVLQPLPRSAADDVRCRREGPRRRARASSSAAGSPASTPTGPTSSWPAR